MEALENFMSLAEDTSVEEAAANISSLIDSFDTVNMD